MESRARLFGHPVHQMLIVFPFGLLIMSVIFDIIQLVTHRGDWSYIAFYMVGASVVSGLLATVFGTIDYNIGNIVNIEERI